MINLQRLSNSLETIELTAVIDTALCVGAGGSSGSLADKPIIRNAEGSLLIPASQLKGRLRHECEKLARGLGWDICQSPNPQKMCPQRAGVPGSFELDKYRVQGYKDRGYHCLICQVFGNPALPSRVLFDDLICTEDPDNLPEVLRPGVTINRSRRTAEDRKLYLLETSPPNAELKFIGNIHLLSGFPPEAKALILSGLHHIHALGGSKSAGLGWLHWEYKDTDFQIESTAWQLLLPTEAK